MRTWRPPSDTQLTDAGNAALKVITATGVGVDVLMAAHVPACARRLGSDIEALVNFEASGPVAPDGRSG